MWEMQNVNTNFYLPLFCAHLVEGIRFRGGSQNLDSWKWTQLEWRMFKVNRLEFEKAIWAEMAWYITYFKATPMIYTSLYTELNGLLEKKYFRGGPLQIFEKKCYIFWTGVPKFKLRAVLGFPLNFLQGGLWMES